MRLLRNLIIISVLLVSVTVQASGVDELVRIKQNYARMLVPSGKDPFGLLSILSSIQPETEISDQVVVELHQRYPFDLKKVETFLSQKPEHGRILITMTKSVLAGNLKFMRNVFWSW